MDIIVKYKVQVYLSNAVGKIEDELNELAAQGYVVKFMFQDVNNRYVLLLERLDVQQKEQKEVQSKDK